MWPFGGSGKGGKSVPTSRVMELSSRGVSETDIIRTLKNEGYSPGEVDSAMKQALRGAVGGPRGPPQPSFSQNPPGPPGPQGDMPPSPNEQAPPGPPEPQGYGNPPPGMGMPSAPSDPVSAERNAPPSNVGELGMPPLPGEPGFDPDQDLTPPDRPGDDEPIDRLPERTSPRQHKVDQRRELEEMVEGIVDEKWNRLSGELDSIRSQFMDMQTRLSGLESSMKNTLKEKESGYSDIEDKIDTYRSSMGEMSSRMNAVEDAMKNTMTPMMQTMRSLTQAVKDLKEMKTGSPELPKEEPKKPSKDDEEKGFDEYDDGPETDLEKKP